MSIPEEFQGENFKFASNFIAVPPKDELRLSEMRTIVGDLTTVVLSEFTVLSKSLQALGNIDSPMSAGRYSAAAALQNRMSQPPGGAAPVAGMTPVDKRLSGGQGPNAGPSSDKHRGRGKGRVQISIAELYLLAGRIPDALNEFVEGAAIAKNSNDHLWHGKALESIGVCLILLARYRVDCQV